MLEGSDGVMVEEACECGLQWQQCYDQGEQHKHHPIRSRYKEAMIVG